MLTVSTKTEVLLQKLTFGIIVKGHAREHQLIERAATQTAEAGEIIYYRENSSIASHHHSLSVFIIFMSCYHYVVIHTDWWI